MNINQTSYDVIIIGGGPAGIMAALSVVKHHPDYSVAILDRTYELGRKFLISGAGRGNLTNINLQNGPRGFFNCDQEFVSSIFSQFGYTEILKFFEDLGVLTYEEKKTGRGKIFPVIDHAKTVRDMLVDLLVENSVVICCNTVITSLQKSQDRWVIKTKDKEYSSHVVIMATGGKTYPALGADGSGYTLAASVGHKIIPPVVAAVPLVSKNLLSHFMQSEKMIMQTTSIVGGRDMTTTVGDVMFTQYGYSGPAIFDISRDISVCINRKGKKDVAVRLSFFPGKTREEVKQTVEKRLGNHPHLPVSNSLWGLFTRKAAGAICAVAKLPKDRMSGELTSEEFERLITVMTDFRSVVTGTRGWNEAEFTAGGIDTDEVDPKTLKSRKENGLYFAGEILNIDGQVGGFNLSWSWATGFIAGKLQDL